jgi:peptide/nickel transport system substrate-binding protein
MRWVTSWPRVVVVCVVALLATGPASFAGRGTAATPVVGELFQSPPRAEVARQLAAAFPFEEPRATGGTVILGSPSDISTLNPLMVVDSYSSFATRWIYQSMQGFSPLDGQPVPGLADSWELAPDGLTYTFRLNSDARWHDGVDVTAEDVAFTLDVVLNPKTNSRFAAATAAVVDSYRVVDPDTFEVRSKGVRASFLYDFEVPVMPKHLWQYVPPEAWASDPGSTGRNPARVVGTGPFKFQEWVQGDHVTLVRNDAYWDTVTGRVPVIDRFVVRVVPADVAAVQALVTGEIDLLPELPPAQVGDVRATPGLTVAFADIFGIDMYVYNLDPAKTPLFQDRAVRQALYVALDRESIVERIYAGIGEVAVGTQPPPSPAYAPEQIRTAYPYDPQLARRLLAESGWADTDGDGTVDKGGQELAFEFLYGAGLATNEVLVAYLQDAWREIGVAMTPRAVAFPTLLEAWTQTHEFEVALGGVGLPPSGDQGFLFACGQYASGGNAMRFCDPRYEALHAQQGKELDPARRRELQVELSNIAWEELPVGILRYVEVAIGYRTLLHNLHSSGISTLWSLPWVWIER